MRRSSRLVVAAAISVGPVAIGTLLWPHRVGGIATVVSVFWIVVAARFDSISRRLPDAFVGLACLPTALAAAVVTLQGNAGVLVGTALGAALWGVPLVVAHSAAPARLGFGDVKAAAAIGAIVGLTQRPIGVVLALVAALSAAVVRGAVTRRSDVGLGPLLAGGALSTILIARLVEELL